ncbi:hypothetical protein AaE_012887 [Aphanomyces astaci]|uniref:Uncharacterized protein n=2 Tax=Aphanomyces astaci TaxID=112090 RepID=A0A6A4ZDK7_APHAT|nr:hypothetical protein AaE_012887 [Aphanomyces astaci]
MGYVFVDWPDFKGQAVVVPVRSLCTMQWFLTCHTLRFGLPEDPANIRGMASKAGSIPSQAVSPSKRNSAQVTVARRQSIVAADDFFMLAQDQDGYLHLFNARKTEIQALSMEVKVQADARYMVA